MNELLIKPEFITVRETVSSWEDAVSIASESLISEEYIEDAYVSKIIESVEKNGPYMVLKDYFALMHAKPGEFVHKMGMSLLVTKEPTNMKGKDVSVFLVLAATDTQQHLAALKSIVEIMMDEEKFQMILSAEKEKIIQIL